MAPMDSPQIPEEEVHSSSQDTTRTKEATQDNETATSTTATGADQSPAQLHSQSHAQQGVIHEVVGSAPHTGLEAASFSMASDANIRLPGATAIAEDEAYWRGS